MSVYGELAVMLRQAAKDDEEYEKWFNQISLHFEGHMFEWEIDKKAQQVLEQWEREGCKI